jgi:hypothetical protein
MMGGFGSLKQMIDTFKYNRDLLGKKKTARERQKEEIRIRSSTYENVNIDYLRARVSAKLKRNKTQEIISAFLAVSLLLIVVGGVVWIFVSVDSTTKEEPSSPFFNTIDYRQSNGLVLRTDYYVGGPKAAETSMKDGLKHQNSESFYSTGEQFRSALYYYDTLVREFYFFKNGDTIKNFPLIPDNIVRHITLRDVKHEKKIEFDFIDGKIILGTYRESWLKN